MRGLKYSIDRFELNKDNELEIQGWVVSDTEYSLKLIVDDKDIYDIAQQNDPRPDVVKRIKKATLNSGFIDKVCFSDLCWDKVCLKIIYKNKEKCMQLKKKEELLNTKILYHIDYINILQEEIQIGGWAFSNKEEIVAIECKGITSVEIDRITRKDVESAYQECSIDKVGFVIRGTLEGKNLQISYSCEGKEIHQIINIQHYKFKQHLKSVFNLTRYISGGNIIKGVQYIKAHGIKKFFLKVKEKIRMSPHGTISYEEWLQRHNPSDKELQLQRDTKFGISPMVSILVPTYNTPKTFLIEMIESVRSQTYSNWELCIADGSDKRGTIEEVLNEYVLKDKRIKVKYLEKNLGISENTNACLELATGDYIGLFDHDDLLAPNALYEIVKAINEDRQIDFIYTDEDKVDEYTKNYFEPHFKQDWAPDTLRSYNYICHFVVFKKQLLEQTGLFRKAFDGSQDYDMVLRLTEKATKIKHISKVLYHWRVHQNSTAKKASAKDYTVDAGRKALEEHLQRIGEVGTVERGLRVGTYRVKYKIDKQPKVSIIIPNKDYKEDLQKCIESILNRTTYGNYEVIVVENNSTTEEIFKYYEEIAKHEKIKVIVWEKEFNYSKINNYGAGYATGDYLILLNNDIEILTSNWIEEMLMHCQRKDVGIVGAKLYYPDDTIQHAGVIIGLGGVAGHSHKYFSREDDGYFSRTKIIQNLSAVTAACLMVRRDVFDAVQGLDEKFQVGFNDVDFCLRVCQLGKLVIFTPYVECYHYESKSRGAEDSPEKIERFQREIDLFISRWGESRRDPYYSDNLTLATENFALKNN